MAANYWESTQRKNWQFTKEQIAAMRQKLEEDDPTLIQMYPLPEWRHLNIYFSGLVNKVGKKLLLRQQPLATAQMYMRRFYLKVEVRRTNPLLVAITAVYLACKMEESPQHIRHVINEARNLFPTDLQTLDVSKVGECEFFLISEMHSNLIIHQPYRTLTSLKDEFSLSNEEVSLAWSFINDHYMTDLPLLHAPHTIALAAIMLALSLRPSGQAGGAVAGSAASSSQGGGGGGGSSVSGNLSPAGGPLSLNIASATSFMQHRPALQSGGGAINSPSSHHQQQQQQQQQQGEKTKAQQFSAWLADSGVDIEAMVDCTQDLISFYECHEQYNDKTTRDQINRFVKARNL